MTHIHGLVDVASGNIEVDPDIRYVNETDFIVYSGSTNSQLSSVYSTVQSNSGSWGSGGVSSGQLSAYVTKAVFVPYTGYVEADINSISSTVSGASYDTADTLTLDYSSSNYTAVTNTVSGHLSGIGSKLGSVYSTVATNSAQWASSSGGTVTSGQLSAYLTNSVFRTYSADINVAQHNQDLAITGKVSIDTYVADQHTQDLAITGKVSTSTYVVGQHTQDLAITANQADVVDISANMSGALYDTLDSLSVDYSGTNYTQETNTLSGHLAGIDDKFGNMSYVSNAVYTTGQHAQDLVITGKVSTDTYVAGQHTQDLAITGKVSTDTYVAGQHTQDLAITGKLIRTDFNAYSGGVSTVLAGTKRYNGFVDRTNSSLSMSGSAFQITTAGSYDIYSNGTKYTKTTTQSVGIANDNTQHYIYFDTNGVLQVSTTAWDITSNNVPVATVYKTGSNYELGEERHGYMRDRNWHKWAHNTVYTRYDNGLVATFTNTTLSITQGVVYDEDINLDTGSTRTTCQLWYRNTGAGSMTFESAVSTPYKASAGVLQYDNAGTLTNIASNSYVTNWVYATNDITLPIAVVVSQTDYGNINAARAALQPSFPGFSTREWKLIYSVIYRNVGGTATYIEASDYRQVSSGPATAAAAPATVYASSIVFSPTGNVSSTNVEAAIAEVDSEKLARSDATFIRLSGSAGIYGSLVPSVSTVTLGTSANPWKDLYVSSGSIYLGSSELNSTSVSKINASYSTVQSNSAAWSSATYTIWTVVTGGSVNVESNHGYINAGATSAVQMNLPPLSASIAGESFEFVVESNPDTETKLLMHFDGNSDDSSPQGKTVTDLGFSYSKTTYKFGTQSGKPGTNGITVPDSDDWTFDVDSTIEFWTYGYTADKIFLGQYDANTKVWYIATGTGLYIGWDNTGNPSGTKTEGGPGNWTYWNSSDWNHIAVCLNYSTMKIDGYVNGNRVVNLTFESTDVGNFTGILQIGVVTGQPWFGGLANYIDDLRITKGTALYTTASFDVPTTAFHSSAMMIKPYSGQKITYAPLLLGNNDRIGSAVPGNSLKIRSTGPSGIWSVASIVGQHVNAGS